MKKLFMSSMVVALALTGCEEKAEPPVEEEKLGDYSALGTEPGWSVEIKGDEISVDSQAGKKFTLPVDRTKKTDTGWEVRGYSDVDNINLTITTGQECSDGMSDRKYADTVKMSAGGIGTLEGCGGEITEGPDGAP